MRPSPEFHHPAESIQIALAGIESPCRPDKVRDAGFLQTKGLQGFLLGKLGSVVHLGSDCKIDSSLRAHESWQNSSLLEGVDDAQAAFNYLPMLHVFAVERDAASIERRRDNQAIPIAE